MSYFRQTKRSHLDRREEAIFNRWEEAILDRMEGAILTGSRYFRLYTMLHQHPDKQDL